ncbi:Fe-S cluster assembly protein HesB [Hymenobacter busanensis]|uniref:Fe-S cluster assembly protein HesB n=1 Tax=Hymenobacter busanensis TaxID=2607656 RepID=A0A7L4ZXD1_9BACT|nr:Fe-S cluster assembly protein HesB [Hymenobacter busanensis]KAA9332176.1 Fe-S cluster assembly protein HesB [Hymenobacter busanensis]QHJ07485.1 Fe-S cluster assembly protein HesB [Hymenobacter busanensis]
MPKLPATTPAAEPAAAFAERQALALLAHERLCVLYGAPFRFFSSKDPLSELISAILSHRTRNAESHRAYQQLTAQFPTWEQVRDAPTAAVEAAIRPCTWPEQKAPRLQAILQELTARLDGQLDLHFLADMPVPEARAWLETLPGVGPKTSAATLLFSTLRRPAMPVDSHHHRVAQRLGLIGPKVGTEASHALLEALLPPDWDAQQVYDHHEALMFHGQKCCYFHSPACGRCVLLDVCPTGQQRLGPLPAATQAPDNA